MSSKTQTQFKRKSRGFYSLWKKSESDTLNRYLFGTLRESTIFSLGLMDPSPFDFDCNFKSRASTLSYDYLTTRESAAIRQVLALKTKNVDYANDRECEIAAWNKFCEAELRCRDTNERFKRHEAFPTKNGKFDEILFLARRKIAYVLGSVPSVQDLDLQFGPGASTTVRGKTNSRHKLQARPCCSANAYNSGVIRELYETIPTYAYLHKGKVAVCDGELAFVSKDSETHRSIIIESTLMSLVQCGIGKWLRRRLKKVRIDLRDQSRNRSLARLGSLGAGIATVDLSSASDTIAINLVYHLLPSEWFDFLDNWRTASVYYSKRKLRFRMEKFSSMGNGFNFELESLIFWALSAAALEFERLPSTHLSVYGDDIIIPVEGFDTLNEIFDYCGFEINKLKSYKVGTFRESCGGDFLSGVNIRPFFVKGRWTDARVIAFLNYDFRNHRLLADNDREFLLSQVKSKIYLGPDGYGDGHLIVDNSQEWMERSKRSDGYCGWVFKTYIQRPVREHKGFLHIGDDLNTIYLPYIHSSMRGNDFSFFSRIKKTAHSWHPLLMRTLVEQSTELAVEEEVGIPSDPYVIRKGSQKAKVIKIYTFDNGYFSPLK